ncbi:MAG TPA: DUF6114 domain-containing protein [Thermoplasmata archaeon]|nr:DUF6114 domain-containing protein [Thermoplasmata archaeon]
MDEIDRPIAAFAVSLVGGLLVFIAGVFLAIAGSVASSAGLYGAGSVLGGLGFLGILFGFIVVALGALLFRDPESHVGYGIAILVFSLLSIFGGGGFILGLILGVVGGILASVFQPAEDLDLLPSSVLTPERSCPQCGAISAGSALVCARCGASLPGLGTSLA